MATTIINPAPNANTTGNNSVGLLIGGIILVILAILFFVYALPYIRGFSSGSGGVQVNVPKSINVKVQQSK